MAEKEVVKGCLAFKKSLQDEFLPSTSAKVHLSLDDSGKENFQKISSIYSCVSRTNFKASCDFAASRLHEKGWKEDKYGEVITRLETKRNHLSHPSGIDIDSSLVFFFYSAGRPQPSLPSCNERSRAVRTCCRLRERTWRMTAHECEAHGRSQSPIKESCANSIYYVTHVSHWAPFCVHLREFRRIVPLAGWVRAAARKTVRLCHVEVFQTMRFAVL